MKQKIPHKNFWWTDFGGIYTDIPPSLRPITDSHRQTKSGYNMTLLAEVKVSETDRYVIHIFTEKSQLPDVSDARYWARSFSLARPDLTGFFFAGHR